MRFMDAHSKRYTAYSDGRITGEKTFYKHQNYDITHLSADGAAPLLSIRKGGGFMKHKLLMVLLLVLALATYVIVILSLTAVIMALS